MNNLIEIKDLSIGFEREDSWNKVVKNISFSIDKGEILGLVGESGSGKSVSSLAIMGLLPERKSKILSGSILFNNIDLCNITNKEHRKLRGKKIAMIFQEPMTALNPVVRCGNQVMEMIIHNNSISKREAKKRVLELFKEVKLPDIERAFRAYPHELSGGQKQRVMIAMAISCNPDLLIADEPTTALDVTVQKTILELLKSIQNKYNIGILFITHDLGVIKQIANRVAVLYKGEIVEQGLVQDIFYKPNHPYTQGLIACRPPIENRPKRLLTVSDFLKEEKKDIEILTEKERDLIHKEIYSQTPILRVDSLDIEFITKKTIFGKIRKSVKAVNNVSFDVFKGETLGLVGESGCGKTTVGRGILNLIDSKSGKVELYGVNLLELSKNKMREYRKKIQIIFQDPYSSLNSKITIGHAIQEPMIVHSLYENNEKRKERVMDLLEKVGLERSHYNRYPHEFSGGQRQRIGIARALALEPEIIICDESVSALDVSVQAQVLNLINDLKRDFGFTCIFISHDLSVVKYMSDRIIVMQKGNIVEEAEADSIYNNPQTQYTRQLINSIPL
ncbi:MAG: ABC transporter ATP-binding protein [Bacteroidales bacterium]|jgi:peptide/nickel transport system ATP-binding protein|nr:ABC transporter ATP-binding protein [Bacteroidales bacterium]